MESYLTEIGILLEETGIAIRKLRSWAAPTRVKGTLALFGSSGRIYHEPYGVALIISPWNYPLLLTLSPMIGAIAAGNCVVIKPSELSPHASQAMAELLEEAFAPFGEGYVSVVLGDADLSTALLAQRFDYIFFTGGTSIGYIVMEAASKHLTPVTLELGGKSPCIVHSDANLQLAAKRIAWGKFTNAGQTCVAPDYLLVHEQVKDAFIAKLKAEIDALFGEKPISGDNGRYGAIVNDRHFLRLSKLLAASGGTVVHGGGSDAARKQIAPTLVDNVSWDDSLMEGELFGPLLPILTYGDLEREALQPIKDRPKPLALYLFSQSADVQHDVLTRVSFGGGCVNDTLMHLGSPHLPFGGVGASGMGGYHGKHSFDLFSHHKSVLRQTTAFDLPFRYPTMKNGLTWIKRFMK